MKELIAKIIKDVFVVSLVTFIVFFFLDLIKPGFVVNYINMNILLLICVFSGVISALNYDRGSEN